MMMLQLILLLLLIQTTISRHISTDNTVDKDNIQSDHHQHIIELSNAQSQRLWQLFIDQNVAISMQLNNGADHQQLDGTLLSIYTGRRLILELDIDDGQFSFKYRTTTTSNGRGSIKVYKSSQRLQLTDGDWHQLLLSINGERLLVIIDCQHVLLNISDHDFGNFQHSSLPIIGYIGQQSSRRRQFNGSIREFSADESSTIGDVSINCPQLTSLSTEIDDTTATTVIDDEMPDEVDEVPDEETSESITPSIIDQMQTRIDHLERQFKHWKSIIHRHSMHIRNLQLHQRGCQLNDRRLMIGEKVSWQSPNCTICHCTIGGKLECGTIGCTSVNCRTPLIDDANCCPHCGRRCYYSGVDYEHGDEFWPKPCVQCKCIDGTMDCQYHRIDQCPQLYCTDTYTPANRCCPICDNHNYDHCNVDSSPCHANANCTNERDGARCECKSGYFGNAYRHCYDIDECANDDRGGCGHGTHCINISGGYRCDCLPGTVRIDSHNCIDAM